MTRPEIIAGLAFIVSLSSLVFSVYFGMRDRARLKATSTFIASEYAHRYVRVIILNAGRRPIILRMLGGTGPDGEEVGTFLGDQHGGLRLAENERLEQRLERHDLMVLTPSGDVIEFVDLWVEDSLGRRHRVKGAKEALIAFSAGS